MPAPADAYTLTTLLRETSQVALFRGHRSVDGHPVLLKVLRGDRPTALQMTRLQQEHALLRSLSVPGVVKTLGLAKVGGSQALVLEDAGDRSLAAAMGPAALPLRAFLAIAISLTGILASIHRHRILHRGVNPHNFLRRGDGVEVTLIDCGDATRLVVEAPRATSVDGPVGMLAYMSPEQTGRMNRAVDRRADLYSLGVTFYELLTGALPFPTTDPLELVHSHIARVPAAPHLLVPTLPPVLSGIVMKLLSKNAEDRYQSAAGLEAELSRCLTRLDAAGEIAAFPLGEHDVSDELRIPQKLYGRERESAALLATFERVRGGAAELFLVSGSSGSGKSALVGELHRKLLRGGRFITGKFDQLGRSVPYAPITRACGDLVRATLAETPERLASRRRQILDALGPNGQVMVDLVPELSLVVGIQRRVPELGAQAAQHRLEWTFQSFLQVFASPEHPLVFFLDDLQWADAASLRLLHGVLTDQRHGHLLVVGAYRDTEVGPVHPLTLALAKLRKAGATVGELRLEALDLDGVGQLLSDALAEGREYVEPLARLALQKTHGNPFFLGQFLTTLDKEGLLAFDAGARRWRWDLTRIEGAMVTDNVVELMIEKLRRFSPTSRRALHLAACVGYRFDRDTLAIISEATPLEVASHLWEPLCEGLILPLDAGRAYPHEDGDAGLAGVDDPRAAELNPQYRFLHDRVQQAAYALIDEDQKQAAHLCIGRLMLASGGIARDDKLLEVVHHLNLGAALIVDPGERNALARMSARAARWARDAAAYGMAIGLLSSCLALLGDAGWETDYALTYAAHLLLAECESVDKHHDQAFQRLDVLDRRARSTLDRVAALKLRAMVLSQINQPVKGVACGFEAARLLHLEMPAEADLSAAIDRESAAFEEALGGRSIDSLLDLPEMSDPEKIALLGVLYEVLPSALRSNPQLWTLGIAEAVNLALSYGNSPLSSYFYVCYAGNVAGSGDFATAYRLGQLGMRLNERFENRAIDGANQFVFAVFVLPWSRPLSESLDCLRRGLQTCLDVGDHLRPGACASVLATYHAFAGDSLDVLSAELDASTEILERTGDLSNLMTLKLVGQLVANLQGRTSSRRSFDGPGFDAAAFEQQMLATGNVFHSGSYYLCRAIARYHAGDYDGAGADLEQAARGWVAGTFGTAECCFYRALSLAGRARAAEGEERGVLVQELREDQETLRRWAEAGAVHIAHRHALAAAELAVLDGDNDGAQALFDRAIALAQESGSAAHEALASELCARFHLGLGRPKIARVYLADARAAYERWGATVKVWEIAAQLPAEPARAAREVSMEHLDALTVVKASQAISTEIVLSRLVKSLMRIAIEHAGAERGYLLLARDGELWVEGAAGTGVEPERFERIHVDFGTERARDLLPQSIVGYVQRTRERALLSHTDAHSIFLPDPYLASRPWRSLLCLPMVRQGSLVGLLYLENSLTGDAFSPDRVDLLEVLSSQAAISLENAALYEEMEQRVEDRTRKLEASTRDLEQSLRLLKKNQVQLVEAERKTAVAHYEREMAIAQQIQTSILPKRLDVPGFDIAASMVTAGEVGGDYYDLLRTDDGGFWLGIGDVSGHGLNAGLVMLMIQSGLSSLMRSRPHAAPARLVGLLNQMLYENIRVRLDRDDFATLSLFRVYPDGRFVVAGAHEDALIWRARTGRSEELPTVGTWVGVSEHAGSHMQNQVNRLDPGDVMVLYTDGITEARSASGEQLELARLAEVLEAGHAETAERLCRRILERVKAWSSEQIDDQTLVVIRRQSRSAG